MRFLSVGVFVGLFCWVLIANGQDLLVKGDATGADLGGSSEFSNLSDGAGVIFTYTEGSIFLNPLLGSAVFLRGVSHQEAIDRATSGIILPVPDCVGEASGQPVMPDLGSLTMPSHRVVRSSSGVDARSKTVSEVAAESVAQCEAEAADMVEEAALMDAVNGATSGQPDSNVYRAIGLRLFSKGLRGDDLVQGIIEFEIRAAQTQASIDSIAMRQADLEAMDDDDFELARGMADVMLNAYQKERREAERAEDREIGRQEGWLQGYKDGTGETPAPVVVDAEKDYDGGLLDDLGE